MSRPSLHALAAAAGLATEWRNYRGEAQTVTDATLRTILAAMAFPANSPAELAESWERLEAIAKTPPSMLTATRESRLGLPGRPGRARLHLESGERRDVELDAEQPNRVTLRVPSQTGYHRLEYADRAIIIAVAPARAVCVTDIAKKQKPWGVALQLYSLNGGGEIGDFGDLARFCGRLAPMGADAVAVSPMHALFSASASHYAPYSPSTRLFLNPIYADRGRSGKGCDAALIDWEVATATKMAALRDSYADFTRTGDGRPAFQAFIAAGGERLLEHARFEALDARFRPRNFFHWRHWPDGYADVLSAPVRSMSPHDPEVEFFLFLQWRADCGLAAAQAASRDSGMAIGLISDLAVGMDGAGSHAWSRPNDILLGLGIGAPPDLLAPQGQSWGLTSFSPQALRARNYEPFLATLRASMRHAGGVRIDHAIGLQRLWVSPDGEPAAHGTYMHYPFTDLLRLIALESHRNRAIVIGEDLGTVPEGFRRRSGKAGIAGMRVLWFERTGKGGFRAPSGWDKNAVAMTTTHDLPTVAGWWRGRDIEWRVETDPAADGAALQSIRQRDKEVLWRALCTSGAAHGAAPPPRQPEPVVDAAITHLASSRCNLALVAMEDIVGAIEQPNLPGTTTQHPNWRRRLPRGNGLDDPAAVGRLRQLDIVRKGRH
jgi:4-alpha-glucanotransferase